VAALLTLALLGATMGASAAASGGNAVAAKKCKKKKKKCKRPAPIVRATLTWSNGGASDVDLDLFVFDASGNRASNGPAPGDAIPNTTLSPDATGTAGMETFTDNAPRPLRSLSYAVCYMVGGSVHTPFTLTYVTDDGVTHTDSQNPGALFGFEYPDGPLIPPGYCPA
jgi:uncharacterized protein YfaP (DUF2135 family)